MTPFSRTNPKVLPPICILIACLMLASWTTGVSAEAQSFDASKIDRPTALPVTWLIKAGDDPAYAQPGFDDSGWTQVDISRDVHDYPSAGRPKVVWYRLHLRTSPTQTNLGLGTAHVAYAFEIYANGTPIRKFGSVAPFAADWPWAWLTTAIPDKAVQSGSVALAVRVAITPQGRMPPIPPLSIWIGNSDTLETNVWVGELGYFMLWWFEGLLGLAISVAAIALYTSQQRRIEYLWMPVMGLTEILVSFIYTYGSVRPVPLWLLAASEVLIGVNSLAVSLTYFGFLRHRLSLWLRICLGTAYPVSALLSIGVRMGWFSTDVYSGIALVLIYFAPFGVAPWIAFRSARRGNREAYILFSSALLIGILSWLDLVPLVGQYKKLGEFVIRIQALQEGVTLGPIHLNTGRISALVFWILLAVVLILRSNRISLVQAALESEIEAAAEVQQVILPEQRVVLPGIAIESEYRPAREVGGDFFQIIPHPADGNLIIVAGDVAGKGLKAGMLVSLLVGAINTVVEKDSDPAAILAALNRRLLGRGDARATCLAMHIAPDGAVMLANAGHLPPYWNGAPVDIAAHCRWA